MYIFVPAGIEPQVHTYRTFSTIIFLKCLLLEAVAHDVSSFAGRTRHKNRRPRFDLYRNDPAFSLPATRLDKQSPENTSYSAGSYLDYNLFCSAHFTTMEEFGINTLTSDPRLIVFKRHSEYWASISSVSTASVASLSSVAASLSSSMASPTPTGTLGGGISSSSGQFPAITTQIITSAITTDGSTLLTTFTTTSLLSGPTSSPTGTDPLSSTSTGSMSTTLTTSSALAPTPQAQIGAVNQAVCAGQGLDTQAIGVLTTLIFSLAVGLLIWVRGLPRRASNAPHVPLLARRSVLSCLSRVVGR